MHPGDRLPPVQSKMKRPTNGWDALQTFFGCAGIVTILFILCYFGAKIWINA